MNEPFRQIKKEKSLYYVKYYCYILYTNYYKCFGYVFVFNKILIFILFLLKSLILRNIKIKWLILSSEVM